MRHLLHTLLPALLCIVLVACKKDTKKDPVVTDTPLPVTPTPTTPTQTTTTGSLKITFRNVVDNQPLVLGSAYVNANGESYTVSKFKYFISNIVLTKTGNVEWTVPETYQIIDQANDTSRTIVLKNIPEASYTSIKFILGVDSARNRSGAQSGGLDVAYASDMYWSWAQGYIFLKLEGTAPTSTTTGNSIEYHIGGFGGANKTQRGFGYNFVSPALVSATSTPVLTFKTNVSELFQTPSTISFATMPTVLASGARAKQIADNYADMISFESLSY